MTVRRGEVYYANLDPVIGSEQGGMRPVVILQNDIGNKHSPTIVAAVTTKNKRSRLPTHVLVDANENALLRDSVVLLEQIKTIDKSRLLKYIGMIDKCTMKKIDSAILVSVGIKHQRQRRAK